MVGSPTQGSSDGRGAHVVLYDGLCGLCSRLTQFLIAHDGRAVFHFASLQSPTGRALVEHAGGNPDQLSSFLVFANYRTPKARAVRKSQAALFVAHELGWPWKLACLMRVLPSGLLDRAYDFVARHRYRIFGRRERCLTPQPEFRSRFIE